MKTPRHPVRGTGTRLVRAGREDAGSFVNPPVIHASTILFDTVADLKVGKPHHYARRGTPTSTALESALAELDDAAGAVLCPSGLSAMNTAILAFLSAGDRVLFPDSIYGPARTIADLILKPLEDRRRVLRSNDRRRHRRPDRCAHAARLRRESWAPTRWRCRTCRPSPAPRTISGAIVVADNTWATPLFCRPFALGADVVSRRHQIHQRPCRRADGLRHRPRARHGRS